jgi:hypothetical protein
MPWQECYLMDERPKFVARLLDCEKEAMDIACGLGHRGLAVINTVLALAVPGPVALRFRPRRKR